MGLIWEENTASREVREQGYSGPNSKLDWYLVLFIFPAIFIIIMLYLFIDSFVNVFILLKKITVWV